jgi:hypothetical protein
MTVLLLEHVWEPTDSQGHSMECTVCGLAVSFFDEAPETGQDWVSGCAGVPDAAPILRSMPAPTA